MSNSNQYYGLVNTYIAYQSVCIYNYIYVSVCVCMCVLA